MAYLNNTESTAYPSDSIDPKKKTPAWIAQYGRAFYSDFMQSGQRWAKGKDYYRELVDYAMGNQTIERYKARIEDAKPRDFNFKEKNIDLSILPILPDFVRKMQGRVAEAMYESSATAVDANAQAEKSDYEFRLKAKMTHRDLVETFAQPEGEEEIPLDDNDLQLKVSLGYKHYSEMAVEKALTNALSQSNWKQTQSELDFDALVLGDYCSRDYMQNGVEKAEYCSPEEMFVPYSKFEDYRDIRHIGREHWITVAEARAMDIYGEIKEDDWEKIANQYRGNSRWPSVDSREGFGYAYDSQKFPLFHFEFLSYNESVYKFAKDQFGNDVVRERGYESKKKENKRKPYRCLYEGYIISNTNFSFGCKPAYDQKRDPENLADCHLTYHPCSPGMRYGQTISMVKSIIPIADQIQRAWIRMNVEIATAIPKGYAYDLDKLQNIMLGAGDKQMSVGEIIEFHEATGRFLYRSKDESGADTQARVGITPMENGLPADIAEYMGIIRNGVSLIQSVTGQNPTALGQTNPDIGKGVSEIAIDSANHSLYFVHRSRKSYYGRITKALAIRIYDRMERTGISGSYVKTFGEKRKTETINITPEQGKKIAAHSFAWTINIKPTVQEWNSFYGTANNALAAGQITLADYTMLMQLDNLKESWAILAIREKRNRLEAQQKAQQDIQANAQAQTESAQAAEAAKQATLQLKYDLEARNNAQSLEWQRTLQNERYDREDSLEDKRLKNRTENEYIKAEGALDVKQEEGDNNLEQTALAAQLNTTVPNQNY